MDVDACANMMDGEIREELHTEGFENEQDFLDRYVELHAIKYNDEPFDI